MSILELIGNTPMVELWQGAFAKLEMKNPSGSVKDRAAKFILKNANIPRGGHIIEATSGNFGISLALVSAVMGYSLTVVMPSSASFERRKIIEAYGGKVILVGGSMAEAVKWAREISESNAWFMPNQFSNKLNSLAHYETTAPEILRDLGRVDIFVSGVGSGGSITGVARYLKEKNPDTRVVAVHPEPGSMIEGIGAGFVPPIFDSSLVDEDVFVSSDTAIRYAKLLANKYGILAGISSGAAVFAAKILSDRSENKGKNIITLLPDGGDRYYSTLLFSPET
jgi:cysteine synthase A